MSINTQIHKSSNLVQSLMRWVVCIVGGIVLFLLAVSAITWFIIKVVPILLVILIIAVIILAPISLIVVIFR